MRSELLDLATHWCILRTAGPRTLRLAETLGDAGIVAWTPRRKFRRPVPGAKPRLDGVRPMQELDAPILPTFVFARAGDQAELETLERDQANPHVASAHPPFSILRHRGAVPLIGDRQIAGLRLEEEREAAVRQTMLDASSAEEARRLRIEAIKDAAARRRATKAFERDRQRRLAGERCGAIPGTTVAIDEAPAFAGLAGVVESNDGWTAYVRFGALSCKIDAWRLTPADQALRGLAA